ncbi:MAG: hypothetical protein DCF19_08480 [Pseudanabaena frigida]|uniref:Uncharacterized protein n=1 Tax=Pseudanabaena frigida TaxID=945775 RepID=A0A2W4YFW4_9CYAN|nr:MAG: hypothetical protein DCF19_08480 [Pseudanabaena frigida]
MNRSQQAYSLEKVNWGKALEGLGIGIKSEIDSYRYSIKFT